METTWEGQACPAELTCEASEAGPLWAGSPGGPSYQRRHQLPECQGQGEGVLLCPGQTPAAVAPEGPRAGEGDRTMWKMRQK